MAPQVTVDPAWQVTTRARPARGVLEISYACPVCGTPYRVSVQLTGWQERIPVPDTNRHRLDRARTDRGRRWPRSQHDPVPVPVGVQATVTPSTELSCSRDGARTVLTATLDA